jgi:hypothetical protein
MMRVYGRGQRGLASAPSRSASLRSASLRSASLRGASLRGASLRGVSLGGASALAVLFGVAGCAGEPTSPDVVRTVVRFDLSPLHGRVFAGQQGSLSVLDRIRVTADPSPAPTQEVPIAPGAATAEVSVTVQPGDVSFDAEVLSNNGRQLYAGTSTERVERDGFTVTVDVLPRSGVLVVAPASVDLRATGAASVTVRNVGSQPLMWTVTAPCDNERCIELEPTGPSTLAPAQSDVFRVFGFARPGAPPAAITVESDVGTIQLPVILPTG